MRRKSHSSTHRNKNSDILDDLDNESRLTASQPIPPPRLAVPVRNLKDIEDRRNWAPAEPDRRVPARAISGRPARLVHQKIAPRVIRGPGGKPLHARRGVFARVDTALPRFAEARRTVICFKRKVQREVLHALKRTKSGGGARKKRNEWSDVQC